MIGKRCQCFNLAAGRRVPQPHSLVCTAGCKQVVGRAEANAGHFGFMSCQRAGSLCVQIPNLNIALDTSRRQPLFILAECY